MNFVRGRPQLALVNLDQREQRLRIACLAEERDGEIEREETACFSAFKSLLALLPQFPISPLLGLDQFLVVLRLELLVHVEVDDIGPILGIGWQGVRLKLKNVGRVSVDVPVADPVKRDVVVPDPVDLGDEFFDVLGGVHGQFLAAHSVVVRAYHKLVDNILFHSVDGSADLIDFVVLVRGEYVPQEPAVIRIEQHFAQQPALRLEGEAAALTVDLSLADCCAV